MRRWTRGWNALWPLTHRSFSLTDRLLLSSASVCPSARLHDHWKLYIYVLRRLFWHHQAKHQFRWESVRNVLVYWLSKHYVNIAIFLRFYHKFLLTMNYKSVESMHLWPVQNLWTIDPIWLYTLAAVNPLTFVIILFTVWEVVCTKVWNCQLTATSHEL